MENKLIDKQGLEAVLTLVKKDINSTNNKIDIINNIIDNSNILMELKNTSNKNSIAEMIDDLYVQVSKKDFIDYTLDDVGKIVTIIESNGSAKTGLIDIEEKIKEIVADKIITINTDWEQINNKPLISSKIELNDNGLELIDTNNTVMSTVDVLDFSDVEIILNNMSIDLLK